MTEPAPRASVVIVAKRDRPLLRTCLERLAAQADRVTFETIIVLNGSPAGEAEALREALGADVTVLAPAVNLGLPGALNHARPFVRGEYLVSLHDDAEPAAGWLDALVAAAEETGAGAVGSLVLYPDGSLQAAGWELAADGLLYPPWKGEPPTRAAFSTRRPVDYSPSSSLLIRTASFDRIGGADERFFPLIPVDVDICLALRARGEQVLYEPASRVTHHSRSSSTNDYIDFVWRRNHALFVEKWAALLGEQVAGSGRTWSLPEERLPAQDRQPDDAARERAQLGRAVDTAEAFAAELRARLADLTEQHAALHGELAATLARADALQDRADTLAAIEAGGWWRLRGRIRPLLRAGAAARRAFRAR